MNKLRKQPDDTIASRDGRRKITARKFERLFDAGSDEIDEFIDWSRVEVRSPCAKRPVTLRLDTDLLDWFKSFGRGYQTRINTLLRAYKEAHEREERVPQQRHARGLSASSRR